MLEYSIQKPTFDAPATKNLSTWFPSFLFTKSCMVSIARTAACLTNKLQRLQKIKKAGKKTHELQSLSYFCHGHAQQYFRVRRVLDEFLPCPGDYSIFTPSFFLGVVLKEIFIINILYWLISCLTRSVVINIDLLGNVILITIFFHVFTWNDIRIK